MMEKIKSLIPSLRSRWWTGLLGLSLMVNLAIGGAVIGRNMRHNPMQDGRQGGFSQLMPRHFIESLPNDRRRELMGFLRQNRQDMRALRQEFEGNALLLADALEDANFDALKVKAIIESATIGNQSVAARGASVTIELISKLTPNERNDLAAAMRDKSYFKR